MELPMTHALKALTAALVAVVGLSFATEASAGGRKKARTTEAGPVLAEHPKSTYYRSRSATRVKGYAARRGGGFSYSIGDTINTYGDSRSVYGGTMMFRDGTTDRQTMAGPFDHGYFFDSGVTPRGGDSPYMH